MTDNTTLSTQALLQQWIEQRPTSRPLRCWVLGYGPLGQAVTEGLFQCSPKLATLVGVFPWSSKPSEKRFASEPAEFLFRQWLKQKQIPILSFPSVNHFQFVQQLLHDRIDLVILATWGEILQPSLLQQTQTLFVNVHPSLLPHHRGPNPYAAVILQQELETGISAHVVDPHIDTGPIIAQYRLPIHETDTGLSLRQRIASLAQDHMPDLIEHIVHHQTPWPEQAASGQYDKALSPTDCHINWQEDPKQLDHRLRAIYPWEQAWCQHGPWRLCFDSGRVIPSQHMGSLKPGQIIQRHGGHLMVATGQPNQAVMLSNPSLMGFMRIVNPLVLPFLLTPGRQL